MKYVIDATIAEAWYVLNPNIMKAVRLRFDFFCGLHELLAPDVFPAEAAEMLAKAERKGLLSVGDTARHLQTLQITGVSFHDSFPLLARASEIALTGRFQLFPSLYIALAEREQCQLLTAEPKLLRIARRHFNFVIPLASLP